MKYKIGIFGSSAGDILSSSPKAHKLGKIFQDYSDKVILITGGCSGLPYEVAKTAAEGGVEVWGYSAELDLSHLKQTNPDDDLLIYSKLLFVANDFPLKNNRRARMKYRNVISTANCDAGIIISGRWGSMNEFTNLVDMQKTVGVLTGTGGIANELEHLSKKISKEGQGKIIFSSRPNQLIEKLLTAIE